MRIDKYIQDKFNLKSRTYAENLIKTGSVLLRGKVVTKSSLDVGENDDIEIVNDENYASQGAYKLEKAFDDFSLDINSKNCADIGCSNGGFTDCLLRHGAKHVLAVDVADCALDAKLLESGKVDFLKANARELPKTLKSRFFVQRRKFYFVEIRVAINVRFAQKRRRSGGACQTSIRARQVGVDQKRYSNR